MVNQLIGSDMTAEIGMEQKRLPYLDYARVFCAYLVIFGHLLPTGDLAVRPYIYAFHMPFFFLVSGILHKYNGSVQLEKYSKVLGYPFVFFNVVFFILKPICYYFGVWSDARFNNQDFFPMFLQFTKYSAKSILYGSSGIDGPMWFVAALFWCKIFCDILKKYKWTWALFVAMFYFYTIKRINLLYLSQACMALPFYYLGFACKELFHKLSTMTTKKYVYVLGFVLMMILSYLMTRCNGKVSMFVYKFGQLQFPMNLLVFYLNGLIASVGVLSLSSCFKENKIIKTVALSLITVLGAQNLFNYSLQRFILYYYGLCIVVALLILICCVFIHKFLEKKCPIVFGKVKQKN
jgi:fucose 4-O-acetylase-like acetyltransferase